MKNEMTLHIKSLSENEAFARSTVAAFCAQVNPSLEDIIDIKTAVSEAVTNSVVHAYPNTVGDIKINVVLKDDFVTITITDFGIGIFDTVKAREPFYTTKPDDERSGMGFTVMESFMDTLEVKNNNSRGVTIKMTKKLSKDCKAMVANDWPRWNY